MKQFYGFDAFPAYRHEDLLHPSAPEPPSILRDAQAPFQGQPRKRSVFINVLTFLLYGIDKWKARRGKWPGSSSPYNLDNLSTKWTI